MPGRSVRLKRLFTNDENVVIVAMDRGEFDGLLPGMIDLPETARCISSRVDGVLLSPGMVRHCRDSFRHRGAPVPIVRLNWSTA